MNVRSYVGGGGQTCLAASSSCHSSLDGVSCLTWQVYASCCVRCCRALLQAAVILCAISIIQTAILLCIIPV